MTGQNRLPARPRARDRELVVPVVTIAGASRLLAEAGADPIETALAAGLEAGRFDDPTIKVSFDQIGRYLLACVRASRDDTFPLRVGIAEGPAALSAVGYLAQHAPDVRTSLETLQTHGHLFAGELSLTIDGGLARPQYDFRLPRIEGAGLISEAAVGIAMAVLRQLCGPAWNPIEVQLARAPPPQPVRWRRCIGAPLRFGAEWNRIIFSAGWLDRPVERADPRLRRILHERVVDLEAEHGADLPRRVSSVIRAALLTGDASLRHVATRLATSSRTLRRRLGDYETSFEVLLDNVRFELACHLLENSAATMSQIADVLGYAHGSALSRAFVRWAGRPPRDWRAERHRTGRRAATRSPRLPGPPIPRAVAFARRRFRPQS